MRFGKKILDVFQKYGKNLGFFQKKIKNSNFLQKKIIDFLSPSCGRHFANKINKLGQSFFSKIKVN